MTADRYTVISSDCHAGADLLDYRPYLTTEHHEAFDAWAAAMVNPFESEHLLSKSQECNWDGAVRDADLLAQGIVGEVVFPNTVPPFFPQTQFFVPPPPTNRQEYERRWAGLRAHNRWMADFCAASPGRRAGVAQIMLNDIDDAVAEVHWAKAHGMFGGILVPGVPPGAAQAPLFDPVYDPIWRACESEDVVVNLHSGGGVPDYPHDPRGLAVLLSEITWFSNRVLGHLVFGGVFERFPGLKVVFTEQGSAWVPRELAKLDQFVRTMPLDGTAQHFFGADMAEGLSLLPSEYFARNCFIGASPLRQADCATRDQIGVDRLMWGSDYPHAEGSFPYTLESLRLTFEGVPEAEVRAMLAGNAARVYGFDLDRLDALAAQAGPLVADVAVPLDRGEVAADALGSVFIDHFGADHPALALERAAD
ncbi:amidohydrolase family protein [Yinghuangia seranimata]|uniref:amidohydrolase family protein n=1 Tax=Yinghuangia seranimata TaxID=408067 RepID=UPI00248A95BD|nr:amidohydrolase family protein [Yinghuangia seranimata]MDI2132411.1 amidohydrolase family protein [Yinghuangia seranimata]